MDFKPLFSKDYRKLKPFFRNLKYRLCAYSLPSIIAWRNKEYQPHGAVIDDSLIIRIEFTEKIENRHLLLPISPTKEYQPEELQKLALQSGIPSFWYVPEDYIERFGRNRIESCFIITEQKDFNDYIYRTEDLTTLKGNKYSKKRNLINQFKRNYLINGDVVMERMTPSVKSECLKFLDKWCDDRGCDIDEDVNLACEKQALINTIENMQLLEVNGLILRRAGDIIAFGMAAHLTDEMGVLYFEKALSRLKGLYQYFDNLCAKHLLAGYTYINKESDMNIPGLARAKRSYHPVMIIKSYKLEVR
ncbi:MAG: DUF2156 domain-containing protein [Deltaproteobacteria bacterium]|nr:DUF2156 domain-containing protein [Deltaproteobacteria bacterium]MBW1960088.1 DUF2156 domain-containing protein [Deltaproteobacteria bacterium]MBW2153405.1 DUF2156 domain-containing protein [Deltaproteobacteria bacterium]